MGIRWVPYGNVNPIILCALCGHGGRVSLIDVVFVEDVILEQDQKEEVAHLQKKISDLQSEHKAEMKKAKQAAENSVLALLQSVLLFYFLSVFLFF